MYFIDTADNFPAVIIASRLYVTFLAALVFVFINVYNRQTSFILNAFTSLTMIILIRYSCLILYFVSTTSIAQSKQKKVVFITSDGIPPDVIEKVATPNIDAIAKEGKYMRAYVAAKKMAIHKHPPFLLLAIIVY